MAATCIKASGDAIPVSNMQPSLTVTFIICTSGMLPPRQS
jgi:microcystin-dependent protein